MTSSHRDGNENTIAEFIKRQIHHGGKSRPLDLRPFIDTGSNCCCSHSKAVLKPKSRQYFCTAPRDDGVSLAFIFCFISSCHSSCISIHCHDVVNKIPGNLSSPSSPCKRSEQHFRVHFKQKTPDHLAIFTEGTRLLSLIAALHRKSSNPPCFDQLPYCPPTAAVPSNNAPTPSSPWPPARSPP